MGAIPLERYEEDDAQAAPATSPRDVSVIIVTYWTGPLLRRAIASVLAQPRVAEIILVDNGNWEHEIAQATALAEEGDPPIRLVSGHGNIGFAAACNLGARRAAGEYLLILNPDAVLETGGLEKLFAAAEGRARPWMVGPKLLDSSGVEQAGSRRRTLTPWRALVEMLKLYRLAPRHPYFRRFNQNTDPCPKKVVETATISGACMFLPRSDYEAVGGMDERYFLHVEDIDFCLRFRDGGGAIFFAPDVAVVHRKSSSRVNRLRVEYHKARSLIRYFWTHFRDPYPPGFLTLVSAGVWVVFGLRAAAAGGAFLLARAGFAARRRGVARWRRIWARKNSR